MGRKPVGKRAMTNAERQRRHRKALKRQPDPHLTGFSQGRLSVIDDHLKIASQEFRQELAAVCLQFASDSGEDRAAAAAKASEMVRASGRHWLEILGVTLSQMTQCEFDEWVIKHGRAS
jgi:hypothetical protein